MNKRKEKLFLFFSDFISINLTWLAFYSIRVYSGWFDMLGEPAFWSPMLIVYIFWLSIYVFIGLYQPWFARSRFDELSTLFKVTFYGVIILFFLIFFDDNSSEPNSKAYPINRSLILIYWGLLYGFSSIGRLFIRFIQRYLLIKGFGRKNTLIMGTGKQAKDIYIEIKDHRGLGLDIIGFVDLEEKESEIKEIKDLPILGNLSNFDNLVQDNQVKEIIFALENHQNDMLIDIISKCENYNLELKIVPNLYEILSGQARTMQLYSVPLIDINTQIMPVWEQKAKRIMDIIVALMILAVSSPIVLAASIAIKINSKGPIFYMQERCGLNGKLFRVVKFRSMYTDAETKTGPVWSQRNDPRVTSVGKFMRKVRIDEIPQMWNVLKGEMSLIGPRPERLFFVEKLSQEIPYYKRRLRVKPGVTGWAQVKHKYDENVEDVKEKVKYDLFYIENMSLRMDMKILFRTVLVVLFGKGHYN